jgi:hypothetical protein
VVLPVPLFPDYNWTVCSLKELRRISRALYRRPPTTCTLCGAQLEYNPAAGWYVRVDGGFVCAAATFHVLTNGRRAHRYAYVHVT